MKIAECDYPIPFISIEPAFMRELFVNPLGGNGHMISMGQEMRGVLGLVPGILEWLLNING